jgi:Flp pilus assembly pilin Flp
VITIRHFSFRRQTKGAALVEYVVLLAITVVAIPALVIFGGKVPELLDGPFGLETPADMPTEVIVPGCVGTGQCTPDEEVVSWCIAQFGSGKRCGDIPIVPIAAPDGGGGVAPFVVPIPPDAPSDPRIQWAVSNRNEDYNPKVYSNSTTSGLGNTDQELSHPIVHPAARYCAARGMALPAVEQLAAMAPHMEELNLGEAAYLSSSQYWAAGGYNPPPVLEPLNYVRTYDFGKFKRDMNPYAHAFVTHDPLVRCIF